jgi:hypothetical protein
MRSRCRSWAVVACLLACCGLLTFSPAYAQAKKLSASEASSHVGESGTVCGRVVSANYAVRSKGQPTFLNFDKPYPNEVFTVVIWGTNRAKFGAPEEQYRGKAICVTGNITEYRGVPQIIASAPAQFVLAGQATQPPSSYTVPSGATAQCRDGSYSFSQSRSGTCSHHGGVSRWLQ